MAVFDIVSSLANIVVTLHYTAAALGLGSQYLSDTGSSEMEIMLRDLLGFPEPLRAYETVCIGHADMKPSSRIVKETDEIVHFERFDQSRGKSDAEIRQFIIKNGTIPGPDDAPRPVKISTSQCLRNKLLCRTKIERMQGIFLIIR